MSRDYLINAPLIASEPTKVFITGANRGFGLSFAQQYLAQGATVFATARNPAESEALRSLATRHGNQLQTLTLDVGSEASIQTASTLTASLTDSLDILINNAGIGFGAPAVRHLEQFGTLTLDSMLISFQVNAIGPVLLSQALTPLLRHSPYARIVNISSWLGSLRERTPDYDGSYPYSATKAALNMFSRIMGYTLAGDRIITVSLDPGWARTDMGGADADQDVDETVAAMIGRIGALTMADSGRFLLWSGGETEW